MRHKGGRRAAYHITRRVFNGHKNTRHVPNTSRGVNKCPLYFISDAWCTMS